MVDRWIGNLLEKVDDLGLADSTMVMLVSDHGHALGEHGIIGKVPRFLYPELVDMPMLICHPEGYGASVRVDEWTYNLDLVSTAYSALGVEAPMRLDGIDLMALTEGAMSGRSWVTTAFNDYVHYRDRERAMIVRNDGGDARLFDLIEDPDWQHDVAEEKPNMVDELFARCLSDAGGDFPRYGDVRQSDTGAWYGV